MISINSLSTNKKSSLEKFAKSGYLMKGIVYLLIGILATMTAFGLGGEVSGKTGIFQFILEQPFGRILLGIVSLGLFGYTAWRWTQAFINPENDKDDTQNKFRRIGFFISGISYGSVATYAAKMVIQGGSSSSGGGRTTAVSQILEIPAGEIIIGILALFIFGKGVYDIWKGISNKHMNKISDLGFKTKEVVRRAGQVGYISRGIVLLVGGYITARAAIESNASKAGGTEGAFEFMFSSVNAWLVGLIALGLAFYGLFMIIKAKEFYIH
ncbi:protein of unknown function (DUF1206) [Bernardetia litoralis DSM 6794]|uniref:DUF1206 domain-containing protein n=1 Tax=Bernardetia litoralis (strain ATCC 23117 / DSM 6794 / NBRC 15988 / NCIMB 1366 / Fx l1 / Sio-4) TaxID=880071 RepID=I4AQD0_BERLS|nr:DUF1206 domain-containing protein [Bernardetia litoralis]AFM06165.1 protein of unknown function (DUF1206) [Bernardetia litoralis DSM 6794]